MRIRRHGAQGIASHLLAIAVVWVDACRPQRRLQGWTLVAPTVVDGRWIRGPSCRTASWTRWVPRMISRWHWQMRPTRGQRAQTQARRKSKTAWRR